MWYEPGATVRAPGELSRRPADLRTAFWPELFRNVMSPAASRLFVPRGRQTVKRGEPVFNVPPVVIALVALLLGLEVLRHILPIESEARLMSALAFVPIRLTAQINATGVTEHLIAWSSAAGDEAAARVTLASYFLRQVPTPAFPTLLTYALLHGGWAHVGLNSVWLLAFGTPLARRIGAGRFLLLLVLCAIAGAITHWALFPFGVEPLVGASAGVSGCMGAALRFAFHGRPAGQPDDEVPRALSLVEIFRDRRALSFLVVWFASNALFGAGSVSFGLSDQPVAWQAHVGGFLVGLFLFRWFDPLPARTAPLETPLPTPGDP